MPTTLSDITTKPMTCAELKAALDNRGHIYDPFFGRWMDVDRLQFDGFRALCERRSELFAKALDLSHIETLPWSKMLRIVNDAVERGFIFGSMAVDLMGCSATFSGVRASDGIPVYVLVRADFVIRKSHVKLVSHQAGWMQEILRAKGTPEQTGIALSVVAGGQLYTDRHGFPEPLWETTFVPI